MIQLGGHHPSCQYLTKIARFWGQTFPVTKDKWEKPHAVIIDLGVAEMFSVADPAGRFIGGTPTTMAPEVWLGNFGPKCDVWSLGCIMLLGFKR